MEMDLASDEGAATTAKLRVAVSLIALLLALSLFAVRPGSAEAHWWGSYHWNRGGSSFGIGIQNTAAHVSLASAAITNANAKLAPVYFVRRNYHSSISVFDGYYGNTGWAGLASLESLSGSHILHAHARYNRSYPASNGYRQGLFCQEIAHTIGLNHSNTGDCMGLSYYNQDKFYYGPHNSTDVWNYYRYHGVT